MKLANVAATVLGTGGLLACVVYYNASSSASSSSKVEAVSIGIDYEPSTKKKVLQGNPVSSLAVSGVFPHKVKNIADIKKGMQVDWTKKDLLFSTEQDETCLSGDQKSIYIRYISHYPNNPKGMPNFLYTDVQIPPTAEQGFQERTPFVSEQVLRGQYEWNRNYYMLWWYGQDQKLLVEQEAEIEEMEKNLEVLRADYLQALRAAAESGNAYVMEGPEAKAYFKFQKDYQKKIQAVVTGSSKALNEKIYDRIEVTNPPPLKSFRYDNVEKQGTHFEVAETKYKKKEIKEFFASLDADELNDVSAEIVEVLKPLQELGENLVANGEKTVLGYSCNNQILPDWDSETCSRDFPGLGSIMLKSRIHKRVTEAVYIQENPCVPDSQFMEPSDVSFDK